MITVMSARALLVAAFISLITLSVSAQVLLGKKTTPAAFSASTIRDVVNNLNTLNQSNTIKVYVYTSLFYLGTGPLTIKKSLPSTSSNKPLTEEELIEKMLEESNDVNLTKFPELQKAGDRKAQKILNALPNRDNILLVNISMAYRLIAYGKPPYYKKSYAHITLLSGTNISGSIKTDLQAHFNSLDGSVDFNKEDNFKSNDHFLLDVVQHLSTSVLPITITYDDPDNKNFDNNNHLQCSAHPSFQTKPINGLPWKCIPADGTFISIKVNIDRKSQNLNYPLEFKVGDDVNFKLKSPVLDANSLLWISGTAKNKETSIIPILNGKSLELQKINVVAYDKLVLEVTVVLIEEENDDVQLIPMETANLAPSTPVVHSGVNKFLDSTVGGDDVAVKNASGDSVIIAGPNGVCETLAIDFNFKPVDIDRAELERQLNLFYNPIMVEWKVDQTKHKKILNYDLNKNSALDLRLIAPKGVVVLAPEEDLINAKGKIDSKSHHLFLINDYARAYQDDSQIRGRTTGDLKSAIIFTDVHKQSIKDNTYGAKLSLPPLLDYMITTCAHELCHAISTSLRDFGPDDSANLMAQGHSTWLNKTTFRKFQWDYIHQP